MLTSDLASRLKDYRQRRNWNQQQLADFLNVGKGTVGNWESRKNGMPSSTLREVAQKLGVTEGWLIGGEPQILSEEPPKYGEPENDASLQDVPVISYAEAGNGKNFSDLANQIEEKLRSDVKDPNSYALIVQGDSMMPNIMPGDRVIFSPNREPINGKIVCARLEKSGEVFIKLFQSDGKSVKLISYNQIYPPMEFRKAEFRFIHPMHELRRK